MYQLILFIYDPTFKLIQSLIQARKIIKDFKVNELPLMTTFIKALLNNTKFKIDKKLFA